MKRFFKNWAGRKSPSPRKSRPSRRRHTSKRADVRHHEHEHDEAELPGLVPLTFLGYQYLPDGSFQPVYSAIQAAAYDAAQTTTAGRHQNQTESGHDNLVGSQHFCYKCGKARSKRYHMDNPIIPGSKAPASCCTKCRKKNTTSDPGAKYLQHFCVECGRVRSRAYHDENPVRAGQTPRPSYCLKCRMKRKQIADHDDWEDIDAGETILALPRLKMPPSDYRVATEHGLIVPSASNEDFESDDSVKLKRHRKTSKDSTKLSVPATSQRNASRESVRSSRSFQASVEDAPPTPPRTPSPIVQEKQPAEKKHRAEKRPSAEQKVAPEAPEKEPSVLSTTPTTAPVAGVATAGETALVAPPVSQDCQKHVHVVYVHAPCHHHGCNDHNHSSHKASMSRTRGRRADSITTTTSSKQSRRVAFATPEVSSRHEADADYDRTAVPENHEESYEFGVNAGGSRSNYNVSGLNPDRPPRRSPTPGPVSRGFDSSSGPSSSGYASSYSEVDQPRLDGYSPPPEYTQAPPKVFTPEEIKALWEQGEQPVHPRKQPQEAERRSNDGAPGRDYSYQNRENYTANQRSASEGNYPPSSGTNSRPSASSYGSGHPGNSGSSDYRPSDYRSASDGRYKNDENVDPKTRYNGFTSSRPSQSENRGGSSQQNSSMYNTNHNNEYNSTRSSQSRGPRSSENNNPNLYNNSSNRTDGHSTSRPSQSRTSSRQSENNPPSMYNNNNNHQGNNYPRSRPSEQSQSERPSTGNQENNPPKCESKRESKRDTSRQTSTSTSTSFRDAPFTARERMWTDGPEEALKLREAMERLQRAAASATLKTPKCPPTPEIHVNDNPIPEVTPDVSTPDFGSTMPDLGSDRRDFTSDTRAFSSGTFDSTKPIFGADKRDFASTTRDFNSAQFASDKLDFGSSSTRNFTSSTTCDFTSFESAKPSFDKRDFSPNMPDDFVPPRPSGFAGPPPPPVFSTPKATWEHPCGPFCNDFCPDRADYIDRDIREVDSDEEREILGAKASTKRSKRSSASSLRKPSSDRAYRLALVRLGRPSPAEGGPSPTKSVGST